MNGQVNISLIPLAVSRIKEEIETLHALAVQFTKETDCTLVVDIAKSFCKQFENTFLRISLNCIVTT